MDKSIRKYTSFDELKVDEYRYWQSRPVYERVAVAFDVAWDRRVDAVCDEESNLRAHFISREDLIAAKRAAGRRQDLADIEAIEKAVQSAKPKRAE